MEQTPLWHNSFMERTELKDALRDRKGAVVKDILQELFDVARELDAEYSAQHGVVGEGWRGPSPYFGLIINIQQVLLDWTRL